MFGYDAPNADYPLAQAQNGSYKVQGVVVDNTGMPVIGATVLETGTTNGISTDLDGSFTLTVKSANSVIDISYVGYKSVALVASSTELKRVTLQEDLQTLDEVVVIGYGAVKKNDMTGSVVAIKADENNRGAVVSAQDMMQGKVPGVQIIPGDGGPNSNPTIRIRGMASLTASSAPLIVIDGVPIAEDGGAGMANPLSMVNPNDIESFTVLKDASATAIYGSRASNGVIIITTKKGRGNQLNVSYNGSISVSHNSDKMPVMEAQEFREYLNANFPAGTKGDAARALMGNVNTDWQDLIFPHGRFARPQRQPERQPQRPDALPRIGGLHGSVRYPPDLGVPPRYGRPEHRSSFLKKHLTVSLNAKGVYSDQQYADGGAVGAAAFMNPTVDPYWRNEDGSIDYTTTNGYWNVLSGRGTSVAPNTLFDGSPLSMLYDKNNYSRVYRFIGNVAVDYKVHGFEALRFNLNLGLDWSKSDEHDGVAVGSYQAYRDTEARGIGQYTNTVNLRRNQLLEFYADFNKEWGMHHLDVMAGYSWQHFYNAGQGITYFNGTMERKGDMSRYPRSQEENYLVSFYGRINYALNSKYLFTFTMRADGSSKFSEDNRWGYFPRPPWRGTLLRRTS